MNANSALRFFMVTGMLRFAFALAICTPLLAAFATAKPVVADESATQILAELRPSVVKVVIVSTTSGSEVGNGTGFVAGSDTLLVTNYHVASKHVLLPNQFRLDYVANDGSKGNLRVVALDVVNDLALLRLDKPLIGGVPIKMSQRTLNKGNTVLSMGYPLQKGLTIVSGTNNGQAEDGYHKRLHYSGAVNAGMSGGPAVDGVGSLVGVNVAYMLDAQLVSLLIPAERVKQLIDRPLINVTSDADYWRSEVGRQLHRNADVLLATLIEKPLPTRKFDTYISVDFEPLGYKCGGVRVEPSGKYRHDLDGRVCRTESSVYVDGNTSVGSIELYTGIRTNRGMSALRFADVRATNFKLKKDFADDPQKNRTGFECVEKLLKVNNLRAKSVACLRRDHRFEDLYDMFFIMHSVESDRQSMQVRVEMTAMPYAGTQAMIKRVMEGVQWNP